MPDVGWLMYLFACWSLGYGLSMYLLPQGLGWQAVADQWPIPVRIRSGIGLPFLFRHIVSFWLGVIVTSTFHYGLTYLLLRLAGEQFMHTRTTQAVHALVILGALLLSTLLRRGRRFSTNDDYTITNTATGASRTLLNWTYTPYLVLSILYAIWLFYTCFYEANGVNMAGATVFSDLAPHTAMISSFTKGLNFPTAYAHFAGDGIRYHFFYYYFVSILNQTGLSLVHALNIPSILAFLSMLCMLGLLAFRITGRIATFIITPILATFRSSLAAFSDFFHKGAAYGWFSRDFFRAIWQQSTFIGDTLHDDWGLWTINVFANQRHLALGIVIVLTVILLALPDVVRGLAALPHSNLRAKIVSWWQLTKQGATWFHASDADRKRHLLIALLLILLPYWHGSMTLTALIILAPLALVAASRFAYLGIASVTVVSYVATSRFFAAGSSLTESLGFQFGFLAEPATVPGVLWYLLQITGPAFVLTFILFFTGRWRTKWLMVSVSMPLVFAFFVKLTPDITVNHKFVMVAIMLLSIFIAEALIRLWRAGQKKRLLRLLTVLLFVLLTITGLYEHLIYWRSNTSLQLAADPKTAVNIWIEENTGPRDIFLSGPYHYHDFDLTGRPMWLGHEYYAWSAGHATTLRRQELETLLTFQDVDAFQRYVEQNGIVYLLVDDTLRQSYSRFDEARLNLHYTPVAVFDDWAQTRIYKVGTND